jgi:hypothetical protein
MPMARQDELNLGPLPQADRSHELEQVSTTALREAMPPNRLLFREEKVDRGIDGSLKLRVGSPYEFASTSAAWDRFKNSERGRNCRRP